MERAALLALREQVLHLGGRDPEQDGWHVRYVRRQLGDGRIKTRRTIEYVNRFGHVFARRSAALVCAFSIIVSIVVLYRNVPGH